MKLDKYFLKNLLIISLVCLCLTLILLMYYNDNSITKAILAGFFLGVLNVVMGYISIEYAKNESITKFMKILIGTMGIRLVILISCLFIFINVLKFNTLPFILALFVFYLIFLIFEIVYIEKKLKSKLS